MRLGDKLKKLRELKGYSQENMAYDLDMSVTGYGKIERNEVDVNFEKLEKIAEVLGMKVEDVISFDEKNVFNIINSPYSHNYTYHPNSSDTHNYIPEKLTQLYEDKVKLLEEKIAYLQEVIENIKKSSN